MKLKDKIKSYSFWVSLASAIILILKILGNRFGFSVDETMVSDLFTALCSILVLLGIIVPPQNTSNLTTNANLNKSNDDKLVLNNTHQCFESNEPVEHFKTEKTEQEKVVSENTNEINSAIKENEINSAIEESEIQIKEDVFDVQETDEIDKTFEQDDTNNQSFPDDQNFEEQKSENSDLKQMFFDIKEKFSGNLDLYIFELQEEIRKTREGM